MSRSILFGRPWAFVAGAIYAACGESSGSPQAMQTAPPSENPSLLPPMNGGADGSDGAADEVMDGRESTQQGAGSGARPSNGGASPIGEGQGVGNSAGGNPGSAGSGGAGGASAGVSGSGREAGPTGGDSGSGGEAESTGGVSGSGGETGSSGGDSGSGGEAESTGGVSGSGGETGSSGGDSGSGGSMAGSSAGSGSIVDPTVCGSAQDTRNGVTINGHFPQGNGPSSMVLLTGEGLDGLGAVRFGSTEAETFALSSNAVVVRVPDGLQPGCFPIRLGNDGPSADFEVLAETPFGDWEAPDFGLAPRPVPVGYINPIDDFWTNEFDQSDVYFLQIPGDREASVVAFENVEPQPGDEPGNVINGTFDRITGLFRMDVEKANGVTVQFVGVHSETGNESEGFYRLVLFPDAPSGPQLVLTVGSPPEPDTGLQRRF